jgi:hypothetical protein
MEINRPDKSLKRLERVKRSGWKFWFDFSLLEQLLKSRASFSCWTLCWTFYLTLFRAERGTFAAEAHAGAPG